MKNRIRYQQFLTLELTLAPVFAGAGFMLNRYVGWPVWLAVASSALALTVTVAGLVSAAGQSAVRRKIGVAIAGAAPLVCLGSVLSATFPNCRWIALIVVMGLYVASLYAAYRSWPRWAMKPWVFTAVTLSGWGLFVLMARLCPVLMTKAVLVAEMIFIMVSGDARW